MIRRLISKALAPSIEFQPERLTSRQQSEAGKRCQDLLEELDHYKEAFQQRSAGDLHFYGTVEDRQGFRREGFCSQQGEKVSLNVEEGAFQATVSPERCEVRRLTYHDPLGSRERHQIPSHRQIVEEEWMVSQGGSVKYQVFNYTQEPWSHIL